MIWIELSTSAEAEAVDAVAEILSELGHGGVAIEEPLAESAEPGRVEVDPGRPVTVKTYLPEDGQAEDKIHRAEEALWHLSQLRRIEPLKVARLAEEDWAEAWKKFFFVQRIGGRLVIKPSWREYQPGPGEVVLELDPGMAFGTGLHPTTRMCLRACEKYVAEGMRILDVGTGSAILSIAAAKLGAASVLALDVDPVAVEVARKNVAMNGLQDRIAVLHGSLELVLGVQGEDGPHPRPLPHRERGAQVSPFPLGKGAGGLGRPRSGGRGPLTYDLLLANIIASVIAELAEGLRDALAPGGLLVASGIIAEREGLVLEALERAGLQVVETVSEGDWRALVSKRGRE